MVLDAFLTGCPNAVKSRHVEDYKPSDVAVVFGVAKQAVTYSKHRARIIKEQQEQGLKTVVLETGYVKRGAGEDYYYAAGFNGLNRQADFKNKGMPGDRWEKLGEALVPWTVDSLVRSGMLSVVAMLAIVGLAMTSADKTGLYIRQDAKDIGEACGPNDYCLRGYICLENYLGPISVQA